MKRFLALTLAAALSATMLAGCGGSTPAPESKAPESSAAPASSAEQPASSAAETAKPVELTVVTTYGADDGNRGNYETAYKAYEAASGNKIRDNSGTANEEFKAKVMADFETGAEPDVLFYFNGVDSNKLVESGKVISIDEIRKTYPDYASNMNDAMLGASPLDGKNYSVPVNGMWEGLYVNKKVLADCGVTVPGKDYTWEQFLKDCETIKGKGFTPIACSLQQVPHYWFEYTVFNHDSVSTHGNLPASSTDERGKSWAAGMNDIKTLYEKGYFPKNTTTATDEETFQLMADNTAAFAIDGSWKLGWFTENADDVNDFTVTYVPAQGERKPTDLISGLTMGYYITKKAWDDPVKQKACVDFISAMTTDEVVSTFGATAVTALKNGTIPPSETNALVDAALALTKGATGAAPAVQDSLAQTARNNLFAQVKNIAAGTITAEAAIDESLAMK